MPDIMNIRELNGKLAAFGWIADLDKHSKCIRYWKGSLTGATFVYKEDYPRYNPEEISDACHRILVELGV